MEQYLENGSIAQEDIRRLIRQRKLFPLLFRSALKLQGVEKLLVGLERWMDAGMYWQRMLKRGPELENFHM